MRRQKANRFRQDALCRTSNTTFSSDQCATETSVPSPCSSKLRYKIDIILFDKGIFGTVLLFHVCPSEIIHNYDLN